MTVRLCKLILEEDFYDKHHVNVVTTIQNLEHMLETFTFSDIDEKEVAQQ